MHFALIVQILFLITCIHTEAKASNGAGKFGVGVITNKKTRASESFKIHDILSSVELRNENKKVDVVFADNPGSCEYYISGEIDHYIDNYNSQFYRNSQLLIINKLKSAITTYSG